MADLGEGTSYLLLGLPLNSEKLRMMRTNHMDGHPDCAGVE